MRLKRIIASVLSTICLSTGVSVAAYAQTSEPYSIIGGISPYYNIAGNVYSQLNIVGTKAECLSQAEGVNVAKITVEQTLEKYSGWFWIWNDVDGASWTRTENRSSVRLSNTKTGLTSGTYRVKSVFTLTDKSGKAETITVYSDEQKI